MRRLDNGSDMWDRWVPLTGVVFAILFAVGLGLAVANNGPGADANGRTVIAFYASHSSAVRADAVVLAFAALFLLFFAGSLRAYLRQTPTAEGVAALLPASAAVLLAGVTMFFGIEYALADVPGHLSPAAAQALNVLGNDLYLTQAAGLCAFGIISGLAILRSGLLPAWLGWFALAIGIVVLTPADYLAFFAIIAWAAAASVLTRSRSGQISSEPAPERVSTSVT